jgi:hypothetical protein
VVGLAVAIALFGQVLQLSHWVMDISPFTHAPRLPGGTVSAAPLVWLCLIALALTMAGLAGPGPTDNALAWCALWGISQLPLAIRIRSIAVTTGHLGRGRQEFFYVPVWQSPWRPARLRAMLASTQLRIAASSGLDHIGRPMGNPPPGATSRCTREARLSPRGTGSPSAEPTAWSVSLSKDSEVITLRNGEP